jgi:hypothetical protein
MAGRKMALNRVWSSFFCPTFFCCLGLCSVFLQMCPDIRDRTGNSHQPPARLAEAKAKIFTRRL